MHVLFFYYFSSKLIKLPDVVLMYFHLFLSMKTLGIFIPMRQSGKELLWPPEYIPQHLEMRKFCHYLRGHQLYQSM